MGARTEARAAGSGAAPVHYAEAIVPGAAIGLVGGLFGATVAAVAGLEGSTTAAIAIGMCAPLVVLGGLYSLLIAFGLIAPGAVGPTAIYWFAGFPLARLSEEALVAALLGHETVLREPLPQFLLFQALLSVGFAIGFLWLHERLGPHWLWRIEKHNPVAAAMALHYVRPDPAQRRGPSARGGPGKGRRRER